MAKRFVDTGIWSKAWYRKLPCRLKEFWRYICENCDAAGLWEPDFETATHFIGEDVSADDLAIFGDRVELTPKGKVFVRRFVEFQYGELSSECKPHKSVISILQKNGIDSKTLTLIKGYPNPLDTLQEKEKDKEKEKEEGGMGETKLSGNSGMLPFPRDEIELCENALKSTLEAFGMERPIRPHDQQSIFALMRQHGALDTAYALYGMQFEQGTDSFDPKKHVAVSRLFDHEKFEKAFNRGAAEKAKLRKAAEAEKRKQEREMQRAAVAS